MRLYGSVCNQKFAITEAEWIGISLQDSNTINVQNRALTKLNKKAGYFAKLAPWAVI